MCRSPLAQAVLARDLADADADAAGLVDVTSAGVLAEPGGPMCEGAAAWLGLDPGWRESRELDAAMLRAADLVLAIDRTHRAACARLDPSCRPRLFTLRQAAALARAVAEILAAGELPEGAPDLPAGPVERMRWLVGEMDAARGLLAGRDEASDDIEDRHGPAEHGATFRQVADAAAAMATTLAATKAATQTP
jgi:protein-tyrosine phosphatase